jgi:hypothetical protein
MGENTISLFAQELEKVLESPNATSSDQQGSTS